MYFRMIAMNKQVRATPGNAKIIIYANPFLNVKKSVLKELSKINGGINTNKIVWPLSPRTKLVEWPISHKFSFSKPIIIPKIINSGVYGIVVSFFIHNEIRPRIKPINIKNTIYSILCSLGSSHLMHYTKIKKDKNILELNFIIKDNFLNL